LTGVTRVSKESIFSGLNNIRVNTIFDDAFSEYFGLTQDEVDDMLKFYGISDKRQEVAEWYDGYKFGNTDIYNPWSVLCYLDSKTIPQSYWVNTSDNKMLGDMLVGLDSEDREKFTGFIEGGTITEDIDTNIVYPELKENPTLAYSFLAQTGYLKSIKTIPGGDGFTCKLKIPNREVLYVYSKEIIGRYIKHSYSMHKGISLLKAVISGDTERMTEMLEGYFLNCCSSIDLTEEQGYHTFMLGLLAAATDSYIVKSNRESGKGRYDIEMKPKTNRRYLPGIIIEIKHCKPSKSKNPNPKRQAARLEREALKAIEQIEEKNYAAEMNAEGITDIIKYGAAFTGKEAKIIRKG
ncbi:MAG: AAA family ATPase, partial [Elusimicrobiales bacterium]|nr:AAA family ATPase [Elusimicrobiales bacterium]